MSPRLFNILLILIITFCYFGVFDPLYNGNTGLLWTPEASISTLKSRNVQYENAVGQVDLITLEGNKLIKYYEAIDEDTKTKVTMLLPDKIDPLRLRNEVQTIADNAGIPISSITIMPDQTQRGVLGAYKVSLGMVIRYSAFKQLMEKYQKSLRLFVVDSVSIKHHEIGSSVSINGQSFQSDDKENLDVNVVFMVYYLK